MTDRDAHRAAVEAGYASLAEYIKKWGHEMVSDTQKRYADDVTVQELVRLRVENERLQKALHVIGYGPPHEGEPLELLNQFVDLARAALQQKETE